MAKWYTKGKKKLEEYRKRMEEGCRVGAAGLSDLTPREIREVEEKCKTTVKRILYESEGACIVETAPKKILKGRRQSWCVGKKLKNTSFNPIQDTFIEGQKVLNRRQAEEAQRMEKRAEEAQRMEKLRKFSQSGLVHSRGDSTKNTSTNKIESTTPNEVEFKSNFNQLNDGFEISEIFENRTQEKSGVFRVPNKFKPVEMTHPYITLEEEFRFFVMEALTRRGATVWDSRPDIGKTKEVVWVRNLPVTPRVGDIPFLWDETYAIVELKVCLLYCHKGTAKKYYSHTCSVNILPVQHKFMKKGNGLLLIMAEPTPRFLGWESIWTYSKEECSREVAEKIKLPLSRSELPYRFLLLDRERYKILREQYLQPKNKEKVLEKTKKMPIGFEGVLSAIYPVVSEAYFTLTFQELKEGVIADKIIELLETW